MSLEHELVELNTAYQNSREDVLMLQERVQELEQLLSDYEACITSVINAFGAVVAPIEALQQRATVLLHEGEVEPLQQE